ncbi:MAG TPA: hypothetical protein VEH10_06475 [Thermoplasmata archaeon]|nr:hypothetical protein [Thermoplasmata archaeon]
MKRTHIWPNHVHVPHLDNLVLPRSPTETLPETLAKLARWGVSTEAGDIEVHAGAGSP